MPAPVLIANRPLLPRLLLLFWVAEIGVGLLFAWAGIMMLGPGENGGAMVLLVMGVVLAAAGAVTSVLCWRIARLGGNAIEMSEEGLFDRRLSRRRIPWDAITWKIVFNGRSYALQIDVTEPSRSASGIYWAPRAMGAASRLFRRPEFNVPALGTGLSVEDIARRMETFRPRAD